MRVRIVKQPTGVVDGVDLRKLLEGRVYDMGASLASMLVIWRCAELVLVEGESPALVIPVDAEAGIMEIIGPSALDRPSRPPRRRRR